MFYYLYYFIGFLFIRSLGTNHKIELHVKFLIIYNITCMNIYICKYTHVNVKYLCKYVYNYATVNFMLHPTKKDLMLRNKTKPSIA